MKTVPALLFAAAILIAAPATARAQPIETELAGVTAEVMEQRQVGGVLRLPVRFANGGATDQQFARFKDVFVFDPVAKRKCTTLGLAGALKELKAEVTAAERVQIIVRKGA